MTTKTNIKQEILQEINKLSDSQLIDVLKFIKKQNQSLEIEKQEKKHRAGILKGTFNLPLPEDFDEPLEDFAEYM